MCWEKLSPLSFLVRNRILSYAREQKTANIHLKHHILLSKFMRNPLIKLLHPAKMLQVPKNCHCPQCLLQMHVYQVLPTNTARLSRLSTWLTLQSHVYWPKFFQPSLSCSFINRVCSKGPANGCLCSHAFLIFFLYNQNDSQTEISDFGVIKGIWNFKMDLSEF